MELNDPVKVCNAESNAKAYLIAEMLGSLNIPASVVEDVSTTELGQHGRIAKVYVDQADEERAKQLLEDFEEHQKAQKSAEVILADIETTCEECGKTMVFPGTLNGTTQNCSYCGAYVDVGEFEWDIDVGEPED